jgi:MFS family permease
MTVSPVQPLPASTSGRLADTSAWEPLRNHAFRVLWIASFVANIGTWMQTVGAQWFLLDHHSSSATVAFVQAAASLPVLLLTLPAGVLAEFVDRRRLLVAVQGFQAVTGGLLAAATLTGHMTPGLLLAFTFLLGAGAAVQLPAYHGAVAAPRIRARFSPSALLTASGLVYGSGMLVLGLTHSPAIAVVVLLPTGVAWIIVIAGLNAAVQSFLPAWVRARALSIYQVVLFATFAVSAVVWGIVAQETSLADSFYLAGALLIAGAVAGLRWPLRTSVPSQRLQGTFWPEPSVQVAGEDLSAPVQVVIGYTVDPGQRPAFLEAMAGLRRSRLCTGAFRWELYEDPADPSRYIEQFDVDSWQDHLEQHHDRLTADDHEFQQRVASAARAVEPARHITRQPVGNERF